MFKNKKISKNFKYLKKVSYNHSPSKMVVNIYKQEKIPKIL